MTQSFSLRSLLALTCFGLGVRQLGAAPITDASYFTSNPPFTLITFEQFGAGDPPTYGPGAAVPISYSAVLGSNQYAAQGVSFLPTTYLTAESDPTCGRVAMNLAGSLYHGLSASNTQSIVFTPPVSAFGVGFYAGFLQFATFTARDSNGAVIETAVFADCNPRVNCFVHGIVCGFLEYGFVGISSSSSCAPIARVDISASSGIIDNLYFAPADAATDCDDQNPCTVDTCDPQTGQCVHTPVDCDDHNACTDDACDPQTGCTHAPHNCDDNNPCTVDTCDPQTGCHHTAVDCDDHDACTTDSCDPQTGLCHHVPLDCDDHDPCTADSCNALTGCVHTSIDTDGDLTPDCNDGCPNDPHKIAPGVCGCGVSDTIGFVGFLSPIDGSDATGGTFLNPLRAFKLGSTIPVKFTASQCEASLLIGIHTLQAVKYSSSVDSDPPIDATPTDAATTGNQFRLTGGEWHFNMSTKTGFSTGTWKLTATLSDGSQHYVWITIKKQ